MYFHALNTKTQRYEIGLASSPDGMVWEHGGVCLAPGPPGSFDEGGVSARCVVADPAQDGHWLMFYEARDATGRRTIGQVSSLPNPNSNPNPNPNPNPKPNPNANPNPNPNHRPGALRRWRDVEAPRAARLRAGQRRLGQRGGGAAVARAARRRRGDALLPSRGQGGLGPRRRVQRRHGLDQVDVHEPGRAAGAVKERWATTRRPVLFYS